MAKYCPKVFLNFNIVVYYEHNLITFSFNSLNGVDRTQSVTHSRMYFFFFISLHTLNSHAVLCHYITLVYQFVFRLQIFNLWKAYYLYICAVTISHAGCKPLGKIQLPNQTKKKKPNQKCFESTQHLQSYSKAFPSMPWG